MSEFQRVSSKAVWEDVVGYCRVVKAGSAVFVTTYGPWRVPVTAFRQTTLSPSSMQCSTVMRRSGNARRSIAKTSLKACAPLA